MFAREVQCDFAQAGAETCPVNFDIISRNDTKVVPYTITVPIERIEKCFSVKEIYDLRFAAVKGNRCFKQAARFGGIVGLRQYPHQFRDGSFYGHIAQLQYI